MNIYGISDLHLSGRPAFKPMTHFGPQYDGYMEKIEAGFKSLPSGSVVINAGDTSWAIDREEALTDLRWLNSFGIKIVNTVGNHDYWWGKKGAPFMQSWALANGLENMYFVDHQQLFTIGDDPGFTVAAVKGSERFEQFEIEFDVENLPPGHKPKSTVTTPKHWDKHKRKLEMALALKPQILVSHVPPFEYFGEPNELTEMIYNVGSVKMVLFGHRHNAPVNDYDRQLLNGIWWMNLLCERCDFTPILLANIDEKNKTKELCIQYPHCVGCPFANSCFNGELM